MMIHRSSTHHCVVAAILGIAIGAGACKNTRSPAGAVASPAKYAEGLAAVSGVEGMVLPDEGLAALQKTVWTDIKEGHSDTVASFLLNDGPWRRQLWYKYAEMAFADAWRVRNVPLTMAATPVTVQALEHIAQTGSTRHAKVSAALALVHTSPKVVKPVLEAEYATFTVYDGYWPQVPVPLGTGQALSELGIAVVPEVTTAEGFRRLLARNPSWNPATTDPRHLTAAANCLNQRLREMFVQGQVDELLSLRDSAMMSDLSLECYRIGAATVASQPVIHLDESGG